MGILLGLTGILILLCGIFDGWADIFHIKGGPLPHLLVLAAAIGWSLGSLMCRSERLPKNSTMAIALPVFIGGWALLAIGFLSGEFSRFQWSHVSSTSAWAFGYMVLVCYVATYKSYIWLLKNVPLSQVSTYAYVNPLVAACLGFFWGGERLGSELWIGGMIIMAGVFLILHKKERAA